MRIDLINGFYIVTDEMNYILRQKYIGQDKEKNPKEMDKVCGYYNRSDITAPLKKYLVLNQSVLLDEEAMQIEEYIKNIEKINNDALKALQRVYEDDGK